MNDAEQPQQPERNPMTYPHLAPECHERHDLTLLAEAAAARATTAGTSNTYPEGTIE